LEVPFVTANDQENDNLLEDISPTGSGGRLVVRAKCDLTALNWRNFKAAFDRLLASGCTHIRLDLSLVRFVDSAGIGLLTLVNGALMERDGGLRLFGVPEVVRAVLQTTRMDRLISVEGSR
jgi:anti-anti-sigma factor